MKVLAIGAAGESAGMVVPALARRGVAVRGLVHSTAGVDKAKQAGATETAVADLNDVDALIEAVDGVDGVFGIIPAFAPNSATIGVNMVKAAIRGGARKFVFSSVYHPTLSALSNHYDKQPAEAALYESELDFTILQPAIFMQQLRSLWQSAKATGFIAQAYSADSRMAYVHYRDVADIVAESFVSDRFSHGTFELAASGMYSRNDLAGLMARALGRPVTAQSLDFQPWADSVQLPAGPLREGFRTMTAHYHRHGFHGGNPLVLTTMLGREPVTVPEFVHELASS